MGASTEGRLEEDGWMYGLTELAPDRTTWQMDVRGDTEVEHGGRASDPARTDGHGIDGSRNEAEADTERAANERMNGWMDGWTHG